MFPLSNQNCRKSKQIKSCLKSCLECFYTLVKNEKLFPQSFKLYIERFYFPKARSFPFFFLGSCNHVAGLLFRVEAAVLQGLTQETCTDVPSDWNRPKTKKQVKPGKLSNFLIKQDRLDKRFSEQSSLAKKKAVQQAKINYNPAPSPLKMNIANKKLMRMKLFNATRHIVPQSTFIETYEGKEKPRKLKDKNTKHIETLQEIANKSITYSNEKDGDKCTTQYINKIKSMTVEDMKSVCSLTEKQSSSKVWFAQRKGRITASKFRRVHTRMNSLKKDPSKDHTKLVSDLMGYIEKPLSDDMRFGISMEMHAKKFYRSKNAKKHKNLKVRESGLVILESHPWIGASPDLLVECDCHGLGLVEIKCPGSIRNQAPTSSNYKHLKNIKGKDILNTSSEYYCQIQGQMALTKRYYTDFLVLTLKGYHCSRIDFDKDFWDSVLKNLDEFWRTYMAPELLFKNIYRMNEAENGTLLIEKPEMEEDKAENNDDYLTLGRLGKVPIQQKIDIVLTKE